MKHLFTKPLLVVLAFDAAMLLFVILSYSYKLNTWITLASMAFVFGSRKAVKASVAVLDARQKRTRIGFNIGCGILLIVLVLRWALGINNAAGWALSSFAFIILLSILYSQWNDLTEIPLVDPANQSPDPTSPAVTVPAEQGPRQP